MQCHNHDKISWDTFWCFANFKQEKCSLASPTPPCNVVPQSLPVENNKTSVCDKHDRGITCMIVVILTWHYCVLVLYKNICSKEGEVWKNIFSNKVFVMLVTQGLSYFFAQPSCCILKSSLLSDTIIQKLCTSKYAIKVMGHQKSRNTVLSTCYSFAQWERLFKNNKHVSSSFNVWGKTRSLKLDTYPSPKSTFCPKWEVGVNVGLREW